MKPELLYPSLNWLKTKCTVLNFYVVSHKKFTAHIPLFLLKKTNLMYHIIFVSTGYRFRVADIMAIVENGLREPIQIRDETVYILLG